MHCKVSSGGTPQLDSFVSFDIEMLVSLFVVVVKLNIFKRKISFLHQFISFACMFY